MVRMILVYLLLAAIVLQCTSGGVFAIHAQSMPQSRSVAAIAQSNPQDSSGPIVWLAFDGTINNSGSASRIISLGNAVSYTRGLTGQALNIGLDGQSTSVSLNLEDLRFNIDNDFSVQFWVRTIADPGQRFVLLSQKSFVDNSLASQEQPGWVFFFSGGTWAWNMGSGERRVTYERENGIHMPLNDGRWHQLTMTYSGAESTVRLFYDGDNRVTYNVRDSEGFDFGSVNPVEIGADRDAIGQRSPILPLIQEGAAQLQRQKDRPGLL
jgi:hypothetical protein